MSQPSREKFIRAYERRLRQQIASIEPAWKAMLATNEALGRVEHFVKIYLSDAHWLLGDLEDFKALVDGREPIICNLLCQDHILPGVRLGSRSTATSPAARQIVTALDIPRYIHTSTCFGFLPEPSAGFEFVRRFENIVTASRATADDLLAASIELNKEGQDADRYYIRYDLHDVVDAQARPSKLTGNIIGRPTGMLAKIKEGTFPNLHKLRQLVFAQQLSYGVPPNKIGDYRYRPIEPTIRAAAIEACKVARGPGRLRLMEQRP